MRTVMTRKTLEHREVFAKVKEMDRLGRAGLPDWEEQELEEEAVREFLEVF